MLHLSIQESMAEHPGSEDTLGLAVQAGPGQGVHQELDVGGARGCTLILHAGCSGG